MFRKLCDQKGLSTFTLSRPFGVTVEHLRLGVTGTRVIGAVQLLVHEVCEDHDCDGIEGHEARRDVGDPSRRR